MEKDSIFSSQEFEQAYQNIKDRAILGKSGVEQPVAIVLGGQPGAGKSNLYAMASERFDGNIVELDCDAFREFHPESKALNQDAATYGEKTNPFVFAVVDRLIDELSENKYNMIIESSMKSPHSAYQNYDLLTPKGYQIEVHVMATDKEVSWQGIQDRYNEQLAKGVQARMVPKEFHDFVVEHITDSIDQIYQSHKMSNILICNRQGDCLYDMSQTPDLNPKDILDTAINGRAKEREQAVPEKPVPMFSRAGQKAFAEKAAERAAARPQQIEKKNELEK